MAPKQHVEAVDLKMLSKAMYWSHLKLRKLQQQYSCDSPNSCAAEMVHRWGVVHTSRRWSTGVTCPWVCPSCTQFSSWKSGQLLSGAPAEQAQRARSQTLRDIVQPHLQRCDHKAQVEAQHRGRSEQVPSAGKESGTRALVLVDTGLCSPRGSMGACLGRCLSCAGR